MLVYGLFLSLAPLVFSSKLKFFTKTPAVKNVGQTVGDSTKGVGKAANDTTDSASEYIGGKKQTGDNPLGL